MAEPDGEAVAGVAEGDVEVELVGDPQPHAKVLVWGVVWLGDQACEAVGGAGAGLYIRARRKYSCLKC